MRWARAVGTSNAMAGSSGASAGRGAWIACGTRLAVALLWAAAAQLTPVAAALGTEPAPDGSADVTDAPADQTGSADALRSAIEEIKAKLARQRAGKPDTATSSSE